MMNALDQLKQYTVVVADTGDINSIKQYQPRDATTNPSLMLKAAQMPQYDALFQDAVDYGKRVAADTDELEVSLALDKLYVNFGKEILKIIPGRVSTEVDASLSFDVEGTIRKAISLISLYREEGINRDRVLIKVAATWEGIQAINELERECIHTNSTLLFSYIQAVGVAQANGTLISPFVGRIMDWYKKNTGKDYSGNNDPGVISVKRIYNFLKKYDYKTEVMGASFRNCGEILELAGCDLLTISPELLRELQHMELNVHCVLSAKSAQAECKDEDETVDEKLFRWAMNEDAMATEKLAEGIRNFNKDARTLEKLIGKKMFG